MDWGGGYVTDIEYLDGFYIDQSPRRMALAAILTGVQPPDFSGPFAYCELGCGLGTTITTLAAVHPQGAFHAIDFHPSQIAAARDRARAAALSNVTFHELSFADLAGPAGEALPMFDAITMHGVWSWVAPELQDAIVGFMARRLNPGGLVYVSYNVLPGWSAMAPVQRLMRELSGLAFARSDIAAGRAAGMLKKLAEAKIVPAGFDAGRGRVEDLAAKGHLTYLAHEYLNEHWRPLYHLDVARAFAQAKLGFVGSTELLRNFSNVGYSAEQRELLAQVPSPELRETLRDFHDDILLRRDLFVRGVRRLPAARRDALLGDLELTLLKPPPEPFHFARPDGSDWRPEPVVYGPVLKALARRPCRVADLLALPDIPPAYGISAVELVGVLVGSGMATVFEPPSPEAVAASDRLNALAGAEEPGGARIAAPALAAAISLSPVELGLYDDLRNGRTPDAEDLARRFAALSRAGKPAAEDAERHAALVREYAERIEHQAPLWRMMGVVPLVGAGESGA
jgi:hypothetical protein